MNDRPEMPESEFSKPMSKGGDLPPLALLPDRAWLNATISEVDYRYSMFGGKVQYMAKKETNPETGQEEDVFILDSNGNKLIRKEFNIKFKLADYSLPNGDPRCSWLTMGASMGEKAHLPQFLFNVIGTGFEPTCPTDVIRALEGKAVRLQLKNKPNKKDPSRPPYQNVIFDAVIKVDAPEPTQAPAPLTDNPGSSTCSSVEEFEGEIPF